MSEKTVTADDVDGWTRRLWHISQNGRMVIAIAGQLQELADEMRESAGLPEIGGEELGLMPPAVRA